MAAGCAPELWWFDRFDDRIGTLRPVSALVHTEELSGEDTIEFDCAEVPTKGDRLLWWDDGDGRWREHVVVRTDEPLDGPCSVYAEGSLCELLGDFIEETHLSGATAADALSAALATSRWETGEVDDLGEAGCVLYHLCALEAARKVEEVWGGELVARVEVADGRVSARTLDLVAQCGEWRGLRLTHGKNMAGCTRTVLSDEIYTALYGWGAGEMVYDDGEWTGGYSRKLSFADVNDGQAWVGDEDARLAWGRWDADRAELVHRFGQVTFSDCEDEEELLALTKAALAECTEPRVQYEVDAALLGGTPAGLGDTVAVVDAERDPEWRVLERVVKRVREFGDAVVCRLTIGDAEPSSYSAASELAAAVSEVEEAVAEAETVAEAASETAAEAAACECPTEEEIEAMAAEAAAAAVAEALASYPDTEAVQALIDAAVAGIGTCDCMTEEEIKAYVDEAVASAVAALDLSEVEF